MRLALAGSAGPAEAAREVAKRLTSIAKASSFIDWRDVKPLAAELDALRRDILDLIAPADAREAFEPIWRLLSCAEAVFARSDDGIGELGTVFRQAALHLVSCPFARTAR